jgi:hypothetical protein
MESELRIYKMSEAANPTSLARSRFLPERLPQEYAATRARCAISLKAIRHSNDDLWSFAMLPDAPTVSRYSFPSYSLTACQRGFDNCFLVEGETVDAARSDPPTPRAREAVHATQRRDQERAARRKERSIRRRECREQQSEEYRLREQQGLSPPTTPENTSEEEDEESDGGGCRMDLPGPTTSVGTRPDYSVGPWDYPACTTRHPMAWSARTAEEKYSVRKLYMSRTVWKTPRRTRLVLSP